MVNVDLLLLFSRCQRHKHFHSRLSDNMANKTCFPSVSISLYVMLI